MPSEYSEAIQSCRHLTIDGFNKKLNKLPKKIQKEAKEAFRVLKKNPELPNFHLHRIKITQHNKDKVYNNTISCAFHGQDYKTLGYFDEDEQCFKWYFIGTHAEYDKIIGNI